MGFAADLSTGENRRPLERISPTGSGFILSACAVLRLPALMGGNLRTIAGTVPACGTIRRMKDGRAAEADLSSAANAGQKEAAPGFSPGGWWYIAGKLLRLVEIDELHQVGVALLRGYPMGGTAAHGSPSGLKVLERNEFALRRDFAFGKMPVRACARPALRGPRKRPPGIGSITPPCRDR